MKPDPIYVRPPTFFSSDLDEPSYVGRGQSDARGKFFLTVNVKVSSVRIMSNMPPRKMDRLRQGKRKLMEVFIL